MESLSENRISIIMQAIDNAARKKGITICPDCGGRGWKTRSGRIENVFYKCLTCQGEHYISVSNEEGPKNEN
jgi:ssDNA-binding Zn-finger/Zn-ribbon topoisomerase 1